jgi:hypothetical protein
MSAAKNALIATTIVPIKARLPPPLANEMNIPIIPRLTQARVIILFKESIALAELVEIK